MDIINWLYSYILCKFIDRIKPLIYRFASVLNTNLTQHSRHSSSTYRNQQVLKVFFDTP